MLISVSSVRGAPGVSCWAMMLATAWQHSSDRVLVEADGSGGVVSARYDIGAEPGAADLVTAARRGSFGAMNMESVGHLLRAPTESEQALWVVPTPLLGHESFALWSALARSTANAMVTDHRLWFADCGRVWPNAPTEELLLAANLNVLVADSSVESLVVLQSRVQSLPRPVALLVVGKTNHQEEELAGFTGADFVWNVPYVPELTDLIAGFTAPRRRGHRTKTWRAAVNISQQLAEITRLVHNEGLPIQGAAPTASAEPIDGTAPIDGSGPVSAANHDFGPAPILTHGPTPILTGDHAPIPIASHDSAQAPIQDKAPILNHDPAPATILNHGPAPVSNHNPTPDQISGNRSAQATTQDRAPILSHDPAPTLDAPTLPPGEWRKIADNPSADNPATKGPPPMPESAS